MDIKRFLTSMLIGLALMYVLMYFLRGKGGNAGGGPMDLTPFVQYQHFPDFKAPEEYKNREQGAAPETKVIGDISTPTSPDKLSVTVTNITAAIDLVKLKDYPQAIGKKDPLTLFTSTPGLPKPFATIGIHIRYKGAAKELAYGTVHTEIDKKFVDRAATNDDDAETIARANSTNILDSQYVWKIEASTASKVSMSMSFTVPGDPTKTLAKITKTFELSPDSYDVSITHTVENYGTQPLEVGIDQLAASDFPRDDPQMDDRSYMGMSLMSDKAYVNADHPINITHQELPKALAGWRDDPKTDVISHIGTNYMGQTTDYMKDPVLWVASSNRFFTTIIRPTPESTATDTKALSAPPGVILRQTHHVQTVSLDLVKVSKEHPEDNVAVLRLSGAMRDVDAGKADAPAKLIEPLAVYFGPKKHEILEGDLTQAADSAAYNHAAYAYGKVLQFNTCYVYSFCVVDVLVYSILWLLGFLAKYVAFHNYGLAIMILVILVRAALHPLTRASQINMAKMGKQMRDVQPQLNAIKKKYADSKEKQSQETMKLYRENKINPAGGVLGCLPMLLQLPIWAALMSGLRLDIDLRHASFIPGWINDLSNPDTIFPPGVLQLGHPALTIPLINFPIYGLNPLPILLAVVLFFNMKVTMASQPKPADEQQAQMQKWSQYSIFMLPFFMYNMPSGSNLYFFASTMGGLVDTYFIRKSLKRQGILPQSAKDLPTKEPEK